MWPQPTYIGGMKVNIINYGKWLHWLENYDINRNDFIIN